MSIPDYQACMLPLLRQVADGAEHSLKDVSQRLAETFNLTADEINEFLPSGQQPVFINRVGWARTYLKKAGLLNATRRGHFAISPRGLDVLNEKPSAINSKYLERFPEFIDFKSARRDAAPPASASNQLDGPSGQTPHEALEAAYERLKFELATEILQTLKIADPALFENIVVELLVRMGYGGSRKDAGRAIGRRGDEGIPGIIKEDHLGLDNVYIQAKRWSQTVGRPEIQKFAGALQGQRARKGIFITTSDFSKEAYEYVSRIESKIVLMDGATLSNLMIEFDVGVTGVATYEIKKIDLDYFTDA